MYMSKLRLIRPNAARAGIYDMHKALWELFADDPDRKRDFLYRDLGDGSFLTVSAREPVDSRGVWHVETKEYDPSLSAGERLHFSLRANAVRKTRAKDGKQVRHDVVQDLRKQLEAGGMPPDDLPPRLALAQQAGLDWLEARQESLGLELAEGTVFVERYQAEPLLKGGRRRGKATVASIDLRGFATVSNPEHLRKALFQGVGPAKSFGYGLLLVRRA